MRGKFTVEDDEIEVIICDDEEVRLVNIMCTPKGAKTATGSVCLTQDEWAVLKVLVEGLMR